MNFLEKVRYTCFCVFWVLVCGGLSRKDVWFVRQGKRHCNIAGEQMRNRFQVAVDLCTHWLLRRIKGNYHSGRVASSFIVFLEHLDASIAL